MTNDVKQTIDWGKPIEAVHEDGRVVSVVAVGNKMRTISPVLEDNGNAVAFFESDGSHRWKDVRWRIRNVAPADTAPEWGPPIPVDGKRPEWLGVGFCKAFIDSADFFGGWTEDYEDKLESDPANWKWVKEDGTPRITLIRLPANHPYYARTSTIPAALVERMVVLLRVLSELPSDSAIGQSGYASEARAIVADPGFPVEVDPDLVEARECVAMVYDGAGRPELAAQARSGKMDNRLRVQSALAALRRGRALARGEG